MEREREEVSALTDFIIPTVAIMTFHCHTLHLLIIYTISDDLGNSNASLLHEVPMSHLPWQDDYPCAL